MAKIKHWILSKRQVAVMKVIDEGGFIVSHPSYTHPYRLLDNQRNPIAYVFKNTLQGLERRQLIVKNEGVYVKQQSSRPWKLVATGTRKKRGIRTPKKDSGN